MPTRKAREKTAQNATPKPRQHKGLHNGRTRMPKEARSTIPSTLEQRHTQEQWHQEYEKKKNKAQNIRSAGGPVNTVRPLGQSTWEIRAREKPQHGPSVAEPMKRRTTDGKSRRTRSKAEQERLDEDWDRYSEDGGGKGGGCCVVM